MSGGFGGLSLSVLGLTTVLAFFMSLDNLNNVKCPIGKHLLSHVRLKDMSI